MAAAPEADDASSGSATAPPSDPPPAEGQGQTIEVDDEDGDPPQLAPSPLQMTIY